jgi:hypothetical protein
MIRVLLLLPAFVLISFVVLGQQNTPSEEELKQQVLMLQKEVSNIQVNLVMSEKKFKRGIAVATIGYAVTIAGGLMLGRQNDQLGQGLLIAGGITGAVGTVLLVDSFKYLGRAGKNNSQSGSQ